MDDFSVKRSLSLLLGIALIALAALGGLLFLMSCLSALASEPSLAIDPTPASSGAVADSATLTPAPQTASSASTPETATDWVDFPHPVGQRWSRQRQALPGARYPYHSVPIPGWDG